MKLTDTNMQNFVIKNQADTINDIAEIVKTYYDKGEVLEVRKLTMGDSNFNYFVTVEEDNVHKKYFGQLFSTSKTLEDLKYELALRKYYAENAASRMKCAQVHETNNGEAAVKCECIEIGRVRYFCLFDFINGNTFERSTWAGGNLSLELLKGCARGIAQFHAGAYGYEAPEECKGVKLDYATDLKNYRRVFTEEFDRCRQGSTYKYYDYFAEYQPKLLEVLEQCTNSYMEAKDELPHCMCQIDTSPQNYLFDNNMNPIGICDLDIADYRPRLYDIGWFINEGLCKFDDKAVTNSLDIEDIANFIDAYDQAMEEMGNPAPGKLTTKERELIFDIFKLVSIHCGFYYIWDYILNDNPTNTYEFNTYWGNWTKTAIEYVEKHIDEFKRRIMK